MLPSIHERARRENLRVPSLLIYAFVAAMGEALVARPALLFLDGLGIFRAALPWRVPAGALQLVLALGIAFAALQIAASAARERRPRIELHAALLVLFAAALGVRGLAGAPLPPADPLPAVLTGLRAAADAIARGEDPAAALDSLEPTGFVRFGRRLPLRMAAGHRVSEASAEPPGTILLARDTSVARLTVRALDGLALLPDGQPAVIEARGGSRSEPGRDALLPSYPGMRSIASNQLRSR